MADLANVSPHALDPTRFALHLAMHLLARWYGHLSSTFVTVEQLRWARIGAATNGADEVAAAGSPTISQC
jgi:urate oxidase